MKILVLNSGSSSVKYCFFDTPSEEPLAAGLVEKIPSERTEGNVGTFTLDRRGTFSPGIDINGYSGLSDWASGGGNRGYADNCTTLSRNMAALPILSARFATYSVQRVEYADGTSWNATGSSQPH